MSTNKKSCRKLLSCPSREPVSFITHTGPARNFVAMIPLTLGEVISDWQPEWPQLLGAFPRKVLFANGGELRGVLYEPDFQTFRNVNGTVKLTYRTVVPSDFRVVVAVNKSSGAVETQKYEGEELIRVSHGPDLRGAMMMTTMSGVDPNEPAIIGVRAGRDHEELRRSIAVFWRPATERTEREPLVFGVLQKSGGDSNLVFIPQREAYRLAAVHTAIAEARSWKSFCDRMPLEVLWEVVDELRERRKLPALTDDFDDRWLPFGYHDGDWPGWPEQLMQFWVPVNIWQQYGKLNNSLFNGLFLTFNMNCVREILNALRDEGFEYIHAPKLIRKACGYWIRSEGEW